MAVRKIQVAVLNTHPIQYFAPLYAYLNASRDIAVTALYITDVSLRGALDRGFGQKVKWDIDLLQGYRSVFLGEAAKTRELGGLFSMIAPEIWGELRSGRYDVLIVNGHTIPANYVAIAAAKSIKLPILMRAETHLGLRRSAFRRYCRSLFLKRFYGLFDGFLAIGSANVKFYEEMGVAKKSIFLAPYSVDNDRFIAASQLSGGHRIQLRSELGVRDKKPIVLYAAKLQRRKCPGDLIRAAKLVQDAGLEFHVIMVGTGEMEGELRDLVGDLRVRNVVFPGFVNQSRMPMIYGASDVFVLPSEDEPWGLAVNEAMCAGLPIILSKEIGCAADLVYEGRNGFTFEAKDVDGLAQALNCVLFSEEQRYRMGEESRAVISAWGYAQVLIGLRAALKHLSILS
jgi:glycosyltransferase involved in cell wall biosynthesis